MNPSAQELARNLMLERTADDTFVGHTDGFGTPNSYGGQLVGQAVSAACQCIEGRSLHSLHAYFLRAGRHDAPVEYRVSRLRDGGNFSARRVEAWQSDALLFSGICSFHTYAENIEIQAVSAPVHGTPDDYPVVDTAALKRGFFREDKDAPHPMEAFEIRGEPSGLISGLRSADNTIWFRWLGDAPDADAQHAGLFGWLSDFFLLPTALRLTGHRLGANGLQIASLDHALWLHRPFALTEWMRFDYRARVLSHSRAHADADIFDADGRLLASLAQEGVLQVREPA